MKTKFQKGSTVRTTQPPLGEERNVRGTIIAVHAPYDYKAPWERTPTTRQNYVVEDIVSGAKYLFEEREVRPDNKVTEDFAGLILGRKAAGRHNNVGSRRWFRDYATMSLNEIAAHYFPNNQAHREAFIEGFKQVAVFPARAVFDE